MMFFSDAKQDEFVANILNFPETGYYIDIGAGHSMNSNNTYYFSNNLHWQGICIENNKEHALSYNNRKCAFYNEDALLLEYITIFQKNNAPLIIDYLSIDIDILSTEVLFKIPFDSYKFKVITIEHDFYLYGNKYKERQKQFLCDKNYLLLCENVYIEQHNMPADSPFEDWYVLNSFFKENILDQIKCNSEYPSNILKKLKNEAKNENS